MNLPDDTKLDYIVSREAWYGPKDGRPELNIRAASDKGGCAWEFMVEEYEFNVVDSGRTAVRLMMFSDTFDAFADIPEFFELMRELHPNTLDDVRDILHRLGAVDSTERVPPYAKPAVKVGDVVRSTDELSELPQDTVIRSVRTNMVHVLMPYGWSGEDSLKLPARILDVLGR